MKSNTVTIEFNDQWTISVLPMKHTSGVPRQRTLLGVLGMAFVFTAVLPAFTRPADAQTPVGERVIHSFAGAPKDGESPQSALIGDAHGNGYGTTFFGGTVSGSCNNGCGTVFEIMPDGKERVLHYFAGSPDGANPWGALFRDAKGNLYGTTEDGGNGTTNCFDGCGTIFKIAVDGTESVVYNFQGGTDGAGPQAGLVQDAAGNLYGTTGAGGGISNPNCFSGCGTVFKVSSGGRYQQLHAFAGYPTDGSGPSGGLVILGGNVFGAADTGGSLLNCMFGCGAIFEITSNGAEKVIHNFAGSPDGAYPTSLNLDAKGNVYGTTGAGGSTANCPGYGCGTVFQILADGTVRLLYSFQGDTDGSSPSGGLIEDASGNLFGTTYSGGSSNNYGTVFELSPSSGGDWTETVLHRFVGTDGANPNCSLVADPHNNLYGTTENGGADEDGTVFELTP